MSGWERKIIDAFIGNYFSGLPSVRNIDKDRSILRIRSALFFPVFDTAPPEEKESYLEAAESLERKGIIRLNWEKRSRGERLKTLSCENFEGLFEEAGRPFPKSETEIIRSLIKAKADALKQSITGNGKNPGAGKIFPDINPEGIIPLLEFYSLHFGPREIGQGINLSVMEEFIRLLEFCAEPARLEKISTRALSILLYRDSKRLENLLGLCRPLLLKAQKTVPVPDFSFLERIYPETMISGEFFIRFKKQQFSIEPSIQSSIQPKQPDMFNNNGNIIGFPLETVYNIDSIRPGACQNHAVLTIENKETFYSLASPQRNFINSTLSRFTCFLYIGGYSNRAAAEMVKILANSDFSFFHAGDLDPDGILILQHIQNIAKRQVTPLCMDAATFNRYLPWARTLSKSSLRQIKKINEKTKAIPGIPELLQRIEETGLGVEQEIIDYRSGAQSSRDASK